MVKIGGASASVQVMTCEQEAELLHASFANAT